MLAYPVCCYMYEYYYIVVFYRKLYKAIIKQVDASNFEKICTALHSEEKLTKSIIKYYSILHSVISHNFDNDQFETLLKRLFVCKFLSNIDCSQINKHKIRIKKFIEIMMYSKPVSCFSNFMQYIDGEESLRQLQLSILKCRGEIDNKVSYTRSVSSASISSLSLSSAADAQSLSLLKSVSFVGCTEPCFSLDNSEQNVLDIYRTNLRHRYLVLPVLSRQGWIHKLAKDDNNFIDVTVEELWQTVATDNPLIYSISTDAILNHEMEYHIQRYECYEKIFAFNEANPHRLILIEGNAGCGKTTLAYKICKEWASGSMLKVFSHVVLIELRDLKPGTIITPEGLFINMGKLVHEIYSKLMNSSELLIWLEGWDELNISLKQQSILTELLHGRIFPKATVVISTRPSATDSLAEFIFARKLKLVGFSPDQVENYVKYYCGSDYLPKRFLSKLEEIPCLAQLAENPLNLSILVKLFKGNQQLSECITDIYHDLLIICLQHHKLRVLRKRTIIKSLDDLPEQMKKVLVSIERYAFECVFCYKPCSEEEVSQNLFNSEDVPYDFDGLGLFGIEFLPKVAGESKGYVFLYEPIKELLATVYISRLQPDEQNGILQEIFGTTTHEMVWVFHAGLTKMKSLRIEKILADHYRYSPVPMIEPPVKKLNELLELWKQCHDHFVSLTQNKDMNMKFLLTLILCCYEAKNTDACKVIAEHFYPNNVGRIEIPQSHAYPYFLLAVSYFIANSGKKWSLRCVVPVPSVVELLCTYINNPVSSVSSNSGLWVWCCVVKLSDLEAYIKTVQSQPTLQWIHFLDGSYLGNDGIYKLCECLKYNDHVMKLGLVDCGIQDGGLKSIANLLTINHKILSIDLRRNSFSSNSFLLFLQTIKNKAHIESLFADKQLLDHDNITEILEDINFTRKENELNYLDVVYKE